MNENIKHLKDKIIYSEQMIETYKGMGENFIDQLNYHKRYVRYYRTRLSILERED